LSFAAFCEPPIILVELDGEVGAVSRWHGVLFELNVNEEEGERLGDERVGEGSEEEADDDDDEERSGKSKSCCTQEGGAQSK
jgi:hypothetical protein